MKFETFAVDRQLKRVLEARGSTHIQQHAAKIIGGYWLRAIVSRDTEPGMLPTWHLSVSVARDLGSRTCARLPSDAETRAALGALLPNVAVEESFDGDDKLIRQFFEVAKESSRHG